MRRLAGTTVLFVMMLVVGAHAHQGGPAVVSAPLPGVMSFTAGMFPGPYASAEATDVIDGVDGITFENGECTAAVRASMPDDARHDHADPAQHRFACRLQQEAFLPLKKELAARPDVVLGEMDIKNGIAAVSTTFPEAGALFFDVSVPGKPKFLSWYRGGECDGNAVDVNCGGFVDLSADATTAFIAIQNVSPISPVPAAGSTPGQVAGVQTVDLSDPERPRLSDTYVTQNVVGGTHTARSHVIPGKGEYVFTNTLDFVGAQGFQLEILKVSDGPLGKRLEPVTAIAQDEIHDMFIQNDPDGRTYLYIASGFASGFLVYDITDPERPVLEAEWDLTPQCAEDWYAHTIDVVHRNGRRFVTLPTEGFDTFGEQSEEDQAEGCGVKAGNGDAAGPLWIVDATDLSALGPAEPVADDDEDALAAASQRALVSTWTNPANRTSGPLAFTPHNQQVVGDRIYLSSYHAGVVVLDASAAFRGEKVRPKEVGMVVPSGSEQRPILQAPPAPPALSSFSNYPPARPQIWDTYAYEGKVYAADMRGGFYAFGEAPTTAPTVEEGGLDGPAQGKPVVRIGVRRSASNCVTRAVLRGPGVPAVKRSRIGFNGGRKRVIRLRGRRPVTIRAQVKFSNGLKQTLTRKVRPLRRCR